MATVQVWVAPLDVPVPVLARLSAGLSPAERRRAERYRSAGDARRFLAGRGWLRHALGAELGLPPAELEIRDGPGKPRLAGTGGPFFNLSRSGEIALVAVAPGEVGEVGVDVERQDGGRSLEAATLACSPAELAALDRLPPAERAEAFLWLWTAKEAYLKGRGIGLQISPNRVELGQGSPGAAVPVQTVGDPGPGRWRVRRLRPRAGYVAAVAAAGSEWLIALRRPADLLGEAVIPGEVIRG